MSGFLKISVYFIISILVVSCSLLPNELKTAESLIETYPDSALNILQSYRPEQYTSSKNRALYGLLMFQTLGKKKLPMKPDSLIDFSIDYYTNHPDGDRLASCYLYKGRSFKYSFQYEKAMTFYLKALDELQNSENNILLGRVNFDLGDIYNIQKDFELAREKYKLAYNYLTTCKFQPQAFYSQLNIGRTYNASKNFEKAQEYYNSIYKLTEDSIQSGALMQEIGINYFDSQNFDSALFYYKKIISYPYIGYNRSIQYCNLANLYFNLKQYDSAFYYASNSFKYDIDLRTQRECYRVMANCEFKMGSTNNVTNYMNKYVALGDSIWKIDAQIKGSYMETTYNAKKEAVKNKYISLYLIVFALLLVISGYILYKWLIRHNNQEKNKMLETHSEEKIGIHKKVIGDRRAELQQQIEERKKAVQADFKNAGSQEREQQLRKIYNEILHFDDPQLFFNKMDMFLNGLTSKLKTRYNSVSEKDLMLCCYILLHLPTYDMLILFGYKSDDSLKSLKRRLPKKLNLENATLLEAFLLAVLSEN